MCLTEQGASTFVYSGVMPELRILYFRGSILEDTQVLETEDVFQALSLASRQHPALSAEIWSAQERMAVVKPSLAAKGRAFKRSRTD